MKNRLYVKHEITNVINISKVVTIHYFEYSKDFAYGGERHDFWEIMYADKGRIYITLGKDEILLEQGEMVFLRPNLFHDVRADGIHASNIFIASFDSNSSVMRYFEDKVVKIPPGLKDLISQIMSEGKSAFVLPMPKKERLTPKEDSAIGSQQLVRLSLEQLLIMLLRSGQDNEADRQVFTSKIKFDNYVAEQIKRLLEEQLYGKMSISQISAQLHYGKTHVSNVFKKTYGRSIIDYYTYLKVEEAKRLIRERNHSITEIADSLNFDTLQYFSMRFKKYVGMSPREYAKSVKVD